MKIEDFSGIEKVAYQSTDGEQKFYVLPDEEAVEQLLAKLREDGVSDTIQLSLSSKGKGQENEQQHSPLHDMANRLRGITENPTTKDADYTMGEIGELLGDKYLAMDGEQKVYVLPENVAPEEILGNLKNLRTGEIKQSQMWRKTEIQVGTREEKEAISEMDKRIQRLEILLNQLLDRKNKGIE